MQLKAGARVPNTDTSITLFLHYTSISASRERQRTCWKNTCFFQLLVHFVAPNLSLRGARDLEKFFFFCSWCFLPLAASGLALASLFWLAHSELEFLISFFHILVMDHKIPLERVSAGSSGSVLEVLLVSSLKQKNNPASHWVKLKLN